MVRNPIHIRDARQRSGHRLLRHGDVCLQGCCRMPPTTQFSQTGGILHKGERKRCQNRRPCVFRNRQGSWKGVACRNTCWRQQIHPCINFKRRCGVEAPHTILYIKAENVRTCAAKPCGSGLKEMYIRNINYTLWKSYIICRKFILFYFANKEKVYNFAFDLRTW